MRSTSVILLSTLALAACNSSGTQGQAGAGLSAPPYQLVLDTKQLMNWIIEPNAEVLWDAVGTVITAAGEEENRPQTEEEWEAVLSSAAVVAESANLLMMDGRAFDRDDWMKYARGMSDAARTAIAAAQNKDPVALFDAGAVVYESCTACHVKYALEVRRFE